MKQLTIGLVAKQAGVNVETIRYYERRGILTKPPRRPSGYRAYEPETVHLIRFIKRAQDLGFTLEESRQLIGLRSTASRRRSVVRAFAQAKLRDVDKKIVDLGAIRGALGVLIDACSCSSSKPECPILEALNDESSHIKVEKK